MGLLPESDKNEVRLASLARKTAKIHQQMGATFRRFKGCLPWLEGLVEFDLPIRHGEGRLSPAKDSEDAVKNQAPLRYSLDVNGSFDRIPPGSRMPEEMCLA